MKHKFLEALTSATQHILGSEYKTISFAENIFEKPVAAFRKYNDTEDVVMEDVLRAMQRKLKQYSALLNTPVATFTCATNPRFGAKIVSNTKLMLKPVPLSDSSEIGEKENLGKPGSFTDSIVNEDSTDVFGDYKTSLFICATYYGNEGVRS